MVQNEPKVVMNDAIRRPPSKPRLDSRLEAEAAEFLLLGHLLLEGIHASKAYTRYPGFDVLAANPSAGRLCKIQVKSRWATDYDRKFPLKQSSDCDFVVFAELNRGYRGYRRRKAGQAGDGRKQPRFFVFPVGKLNSQVKVTGGWSKVALADVAGFEEYLERWDLIRTFLKLPPVAPPKEDGPGPQLRVRSRSPRPT